MNIIFQILIYTLPIPILYYSYYLYKVNQKYNINIDEELYNDI